MVIFHFEFEALNKLTISTECIRLLDMAASF